MEKVRNSAFELLRLIAQYMIVVYHIFLFWFVIEGPDPLPVFKAIWIPLHIGVLLFVLISGYFGIRFSLKGLMRILAPMLVYGLGLYLVSHFVYDDEFKFRRLFFVSNTPYWFMRDYLFLFLLSPLVNKVIHGMTATTRFITLAILAWISCWTGLMHFDASLYEGYNVLHFIFIYLIGNTLFVYKDKINSIPLWGIVIAYAVLNIASFGIGYYAVGAKNINTLLFDIVFQYNSLVLILNAVLLFVLFMRLQFHSKVVNYMASSCLAIYLIHASGFFFRHWIKDAAFWIQRVIDSVALQIVGGFALGLVIVVLCIAIDKILTPVWSMCAVLGEKLDNSRLGKLMEEYK